MCLKILHLHLSFKFYKARKIFPSNRSHTWESTSAVVMEGEKFHMIVSTVRTICRNHFRQLKPNEIFDFPCKCNQCSFLFLNYYPFWQFTTSSYLGKFYLDMPLATFCFIHDMMLVNTPKKPWNFFFKDSTSSRTSLKHFVMGLIRDGGGLPSQLIISHMATLVVCGSWPSDLCTIPTRQLGLTQSNKACTIIP